LLKCEENSILESAIDLNKSRRACSLGFFALSRRQLAERRGKAKNPTAVRAPLGLIDRTPKTGSLKVIRHHSLHTNADHVPRWCLARPGLVDRTHPKTGSLKVIRHNYRHPLKIQLCFIKNC